MSDLKISEHMTIRFELDEGDFHKADEDLFYHFNQGKDLEYQPSDDTIDVEIENISVIINKKGTKKAKKTWIEKLNS